MSVLDILWRFLHPVQSVPGDPAAIDCTTAVGPDTVHTMVDEFARAVERGASPNLDVQHGLHLQKLVEAAESYLIAGA